MNNIDNILGHLISWGEVKANYIWPSGKMYQEERDKEIQIAKKQIIEIIKEFLKMQKITHVTRSGKITETQWSKGFNSCLDRLRHRFDDKWIRCNKCNQIVCQCFKED